MQFDKKTIFRIGLISIFSNIILLVLISLVSLLLIWIINPNIKIGPYTIRKGGQSPVSSKLANKELSETEKYNNSNWEKFLDEWNKTKATMDVFISCKENVDNVHRNLENNHKAYLKAQFDDSTTDELYFYEGVYNYTNEVAETLGNIISTYKLDEDAPSAMPGMYIIENEPNHTKDDAEIRLRQILSDFDRIQSFSNSIECINVGDARYSNKDNFCMDIVNLGFSSRDVVEPIYREKFEIEEQYQEALREREEDLTNAIENCQNSNYWYR